MTCWSGRLPTHGRARNRFRPFLVRQATVGGVDERALRVDDLLLGRFSAVREDLYDFADESSGVLSLDGRSFFFAFDLLEDRFCEEFSDVKVDADDFLDELSSGALS